MEPKKTTIELNPVERQELNDGQALYEMTKTPGWEVIKRKLEDLAFHSWVDPREAENEKDYLWRELNGFHAANNARELLEFVTKAISTAEYLEKKKSGEIEVRRTGVGRD